MNTFLGAWDDGPDAFPDHTRSLTNDRRTEARLLAVQALFAVNLLQPSPEFDAIRAEHLASAKRREADKKLFTLIFDSATDVASDAPARFKALLAAHVHASWTLARMDPVLVALLWAGAAELAANLAASKAIIINEFLNIGKGFAVEGDVKYLHAALDAIGHKLRP